MPQKKRMASSTTSPSLSSRSSIPASTQESSPLFRLPRELRDRIYGYALSSRTIIHWPCEHYTGYIALPLLQTSSTIFNEALPLLYAVNHFLFLHPSDLNSFVNLFDSRGVRKIVFLCLQIRDRDLRPFWTAYLSSTAPHRSLIHDIPGLRYLSIWIKSNWRSSEPMEVFMRWQDDPTLKMLCMSLEERKVFSTAEAHIMCIHKTPRADIQHLAEIYEQQITREPNGAIRTKWKDFHGASICLELSPIDTISG